MQTTPTFRRPTLLGLRLLLPAVPLLLLPLVLPHARADGATAAVGYTSIHTDIADKDYLGGGWGLNATEIYVVPFRINTLGNYSLTSASFLFQSQAYGGDPNTSGGGQHGGGPPPTDGGSGGDPVYSVYPGASELSVQVFSSLPDSLTLPTSLVTFADFEGYPNGGGNVTLTPLSSSPTLNADTTYYLSIYKPINPYSGIFWGAPEWSGGPVDGDPDFVSALYDNGTQLPFYKITADGVTEHYGVIGGFSLTATAVSAVPEPATAAAILGGSVLAAALWVRRRRKNIAAPRESSPPQP